jgi:hypothetical protein
MVKQAKDAEALRGEGKGGEAACAALAPPRTLRQAAAHIGGVQGS